MTLQDLMMLYGVTLGKRRTRKEKYLFTQQIGETFPGLGFPVRVSETRVRSMRVENLIAGDLAKAKTVFVVPFDTPTRSYRSSRYYPLHPDLNLKEERKDLALQTLFALVFFGLAFLSAFQAGHVQGGGKVMLYIAAAFLMLAGFYQLHGSSNPTNFNRWSASVAVAAKLAEDFNQNPEVAFVFCDRAASSYEGFRSAAGEISPASTVILLDCIAAGERLVIAYGDRGAARARQIREHLKDQSVILRAYTAAEIERNVLSLFPAALMITSGSIRDGELAVEDTKSEKDIHLDLPRLTEIERALAESES